MKMNRKKILLFLCLISISPFTIIDKTSSEYFKLQKLEYLALNKNIIGRTFVYDLTGRKGCNKTKIKYLGVVRTYQRQSFKILTSFFVFSTSNDMCHGTSKIKIYDMKNRYVGEYYVGMPESLPDTLQENKLLYLENSEDCNIRKTRFINLSNGLPKSFFIPCTKDGGDEYSFSNGN